MTKKIRVLIIDDNDQTRITIDKLLSFEDDMQVVGLGISGEEALAKSRELLPDVLLMDSDMPKMSGLQAAKIIDSELPQVGIIIMSVEGNFEFMKETMQAGAKDFLHKPFVREELVSSIQRTADRVQQQALLQRVSLPALQKAEEVDRAPKGPGQLLTVLSAKGGVGTTLLAINLATQMKAITKAKVCLVDMDLQYGDIGLMLNADNSSNIMSLAIKLDELDDEFVDASLVSMKDGLRVLLAPFSPELADVVTGDHARRILELLKNSFDYVIVDAGNHLTDQAIASIDLSDRLIVVNELTFAGLKNTKLLMRMIGELQRGGEQMLVVGNSYNAHFQLSPAALAKEINKQVDLVLPTALDMAKKSIEKGVPIVSLQINCDFSKAINKLTQIITAKEPLKGEEKKVVNRGHRFGIKR